MILNKMRVAVVGGGPAGLFFARLLKLKQPDAVVTVFEQNSEQSTYGFGVTMGADALDRLRKVDQDLVELLEAKMVFEQKQCVRLDSVDVDIDYSQAGGSIARVDLLSVLETSCRDVGVQIKYEYRVENWNIVDDYDLIVAADGANSAFRSLHAAKLRVRQKTRDNYFAWYGVAKPMNPNALVFRSVRGGVFIAHYYTYSNGMSTFVAECDARTWEKSGLNEMSDLERKMLVESVFASELGDFQLIENRSIWRRFEDITIDNWFDGNVVFLGDALRCAHYSLGSGTRLAMEDALVLYEALRDSPTDKLQQALELYVERRQPVRNIFADAMARSLDWYEHIGEAIHQVPLEFAYDYLTRTGRINNERLEHYAPNFAQKWRAAQFV